MNGYGVGMTTAVHEARRDTVRQLLAEHGTTFAQDAGISLRDKPAPLFQLLVLATLSATRIRAEAAVSAAHELFVAGMRTPERMRDATWQERVDALGRGGYRRYDEGTATKLEESASYLLDEYGGDLRRLRPSSAAGVADLEGALTAFPRLGPTGAGIFCREVQAVWPPVRPYFDRRALETAARLNLPHDPEQLAALCPRGRVADLAAALVRSG
jgi:hypothetical protein